MIRALIFDFDGLVLDTEESEFLTWQEVFSEYNTKLLLDDWAGCIGGGTGKFDVYELLETKIGRAVPRSEIGERRRLRHLELIALKQALPGVQEYLDDAKRLGLKIGMASSSSRSWVTGHLSRLGLLHYFDFIKCGNEVAHKKPDPELYLAVLEAFQIKPEEAIVLEDSPNGVRAANNAGIFCVAVPNPITGQLALDHADLRLTSLLALPLEQLITQVERHWQQKLPVNGS